MLASFSCPYVQADTTCRKTRMQADTTCRNVRKHCCKQKK